MTALLTNHLPLLAGAPNGIKKLRELVLELAVSGKLVPQDPSDEPARELLKRIAEEKVRLVAEGKIRKQKLSAEVEEKRRPFELPVGWQWSSLAQVAFVNPRNAAADSIEVSFVPMTFIGTRFDDQHAQESRLWGEVKQGFTHFAEGDIGVAKITPCFENGKACVFSNLVNSLGAGTTELHIVRPVTGTLDARYVLAYLKSPQFLLVGETKMTGTAGQKRLPKDFVEANPFPLPPLAEQHRIVAKVDELMALCDRLEARQADAESAHAQLVQALLDSLTQSSDATDFATNWQRLAEHFHILFTTEPSIDALKQTLLQLAVMGKLVPQNTSDEPASELLRKIQIEKQASIVAGNKFEKLRYSDTDDELPFKLPFQWAWARLGELAISGPSNGNSPKPTSVETPYRCLTLSATTRGAFNAQCFKFVDIDADTAKKYFLKDGDLLIQRANSIGYVGVSAIYDGPDDQFIFPDLMMRLRVSDWLSRSFIHAYLSSITGRAYFRNHASGTQGNMPKINQGTVVNAPIPIPPLPEQHRIVAKLDQLTALCDQLKTRLNQARHLNEQLASTLVEQALIDGGQPLPAALDRKVARSLLAAEITHQLHSQRTFGQRKLQKVIYLAEHAGQLTAIQGNYLRDAAGPHDRQLMDQVEGELHNRQWYERVERDTVGHAYRPLADAGQHRPAYESAWSAAELATIQQVIDLMRGWDTDRCERVVTLYAAWNDFLLEGKAVTDEALVTEVMYRWNDAKLRFTRAEWLAELGEMKKQKLLTPGGFGKRTQGGLQTLPGLH